MWLGCGRPSPPRRVLPCSRRPQHQQGAAPAFCLSAHQCLLGGPLDCQHLHGSICQPMLCWPKRAFLTVLPGMRCVSPLRSAELLENLQRQAAMKPCQGTAFDSGGALGRPQICKLDRAHTFQEKEHKAAGDAPQVRQVPQEAGQDHSHGHLRIRHQSGTCLWRSFKLCLAATVWRLTAQLQP